MASKRKPTKVKKLVRSGHSVTFDGKIYRVDGQKLDRKAYIAKAEKTE